MQAVPPSAPPGIPRPGEVVGGRYAVQRIVERGPLSMTLLTHESTRRPVAIVVLYKGKATPDVVARFIAEARTASQLDSDHVARVYEVGALPDGAPFVAMEYVAGTDVGEMVSARGGPFQIAVAADVLLQAIDAIACARAHGVLHRDLRPGNLMLVSQGDGSEVLKVLNFDLSPASDVAAPLPNLFPLRRRLPPSHAYRAPERALDPSVVDPRADVWSLGALLFLLVTGAPPFAEGTPAEVLGAIASRSPEAFRARLRDIPGPLADAVMRCLEPDRDRRFADLAELADALVPYGTGVRTGGARRAREALSRPPPSFYSTMPLEVIPATPPPLPPAPSPTPAPAAVEIPGFEVRTLAFTPTPHAAMLVPVAPVAPPQAMDAAAFSMPAPLGAPAPAVQTSGPSGMMVAIVAGFFTVAIVGALAVALLLHQREALVVEPTAVETTAPPSAGVPVAPREAVAAVVPASAAPLPSETASVAPSEAPTVEAPSTASVEASAAPPPPQPSVATVVPVATVPSSVTTAPPVPAVLPAPKRPTKTDLLRSRE